MKNLETTKKWEKFNWFQQSLVLLVGIFVILSSVYVIHKGHIIHQQYFPLINASMEMRLDATTSYLWFEEMLGGDNTKDLNDILKNLDHADWYAKAMVEGGENFYVKLLPLTEKSLYDEIVDLQKKLIRQRELLNKRLNQEDESGPGSEIDKIYHSTLNRFIFDAKIFEIRVKDLIDKNYRVYQLMSFGIIIFCVFICLAVSFLFYRYENLRRKNYQEIIDMHEVLIQKEKMAAIGTMTAGIAHEVNNPNSIISLNTEILKEKLNEIWVVKDKYAKDKTDYRLLSMPYRKCKSDIDRSIQNIENGSDRINRTVSTLRNFSKKRNSTSKTWFKISHTIDSVTNICGSKMNFTVDSFEVDISADVPQKVFSDPEILEMVLINLLNNSAEAIDKPNSWVKLNILLRSVKGKQKIIVEVKDNGIGISDSDLKYIFDPFFSTKSSNGGMGLGLYLCKILLGQIGAFIEVESKVGIGSVFRIVINGS